MERNIRSYSYYEFEKGRKGEFTDTSKELVWNVFWEDFNAREIVIRNVFDLSYGFNRPIAKIARKKDITFEKFAEEVRSQLQYEMWSRSEYEVIITSWPPHITEEELESLNKEYKEKKEKWGRCFMVSPGLEVGIKVDVYAQIMMNWEHFITYCWNNRKLLKRLDKR